MTAVVDSTKVSRLDWFLTENGVKNMQKVALSSLFVDLIRDRFFRLLELVEDLLTLLFSFFRRRFDDVQYKCVIFGLPANLSNFVVSVFLFDLK